IKYRNSELLFKGCTFGGNYDYLRGICVLHLETVECFCSENNFCNVVSVVNSSTQTALTFNRCFVGTTNSCIGSTCSFYDGEKYYCENTTESVIYKRNSDAYISGYVS
ncbi:hypothetical protein PFISCL1PPCAC_17498, partial [Pristionchus fissidentatus]